MGLYGEASLEYYISTAAKELNCSYMELDRDPEREKYMTIASTLSYGRGEGEFELQCTKGFWERHKKREDMIEKARSLVYKKK